MNNNDFINYNDGCSSRGACSLPPSIASLQELLLFFIKKVSYYILKLDNLNLNNEQIIRGVINSLSSLVLVNELNEKNLFSLILQNYYYLENAKKNYINVCKEKNITYELIEYSLNFSEDISVPSAISIGDKLLKIGYINKSAVIHNHVQILLMLLKSVCSDISKLYDFGVCDKLFTVKVFQALNSLNDDNIDIHKLQILTKCLSRLDLDLNLKLAHELQADFGRISEVSVSHSSRRGKAVLVSGTNFFDLLSILELANKNNVDVYTHSELLISHSLEKFKQYDNLVGHYGNSTEDCIVDFATFPGAILLTNNSKNNTEFLYRGKIFSNDHNIPQGVIKIDNNDYNPVIQASLESKGFSKGQIRPDTKLGINENDLLEQTHEIMKKLVLSDIKHLYIVIGESFSEAQTEYFRIFMNNINDDEYVLSFSYGEPAHNKLIVNLGNYYPLIVRFIYKSLKNRVKSDKVTFMLNNSGVGTVSGIVVLKNLGAKNIFMSSCSPRQMNPSVLDTFINSYGVNLASSPLDDLKKIRNM